MNIKKQFFKKSISALLALSCLTTASISARADEIQLGDVNNSGVVDSLDSLLALRYSVGINEIDEQYLPYADLNNDSKITSLDSLLILRKSVGLSSAILFCENMTVNCGDRLSLNATFFPEQPNEKVTFTYTPDNTLSTDGSGFTVLDVTNTGRIKAFHPGTATVHIKASNGATGSCQVTVEDNVSTQTITAGNRSLSVTNHMMINNDAYNETNDFTQLKGIFVHSTATPGAMADRWYLAWNKPDTNVAVHAFLDDKGVYKYLPYEQIAWHAGKPANLYYLDFEICEPSGFKYVNNQISGYNIEEQQEYFDKIWINATVYTAYLCKINGLDVTEDTVMSHAEGAWKGIATNHGDPNHWFTLHNKTMDDFRNDVRKILASGDISISERQTVKNNPTPSASDYDFFDNNDVTPFDMFKVWGNDSLRY